MAAAGGLGCRTEATVEPDQRPRLRIATAFAPFSRPLMEEYQRRFPQYDIQPEPEANDSEMVVAGFENGTIDLGVVLADIGYRAYRHAVDPGGNADSMVRGVALLQPLPQYVIVRGGSGIHHVADLRNSSGRGIVLGPVGSSSAEIGRLVLEAVGVDPARIVHVSTREEAATGLKDGTFDAVFFPGYTYPDAVTYSAVQAGAYLIPIDGPAIDHLRMEYPFVRVARIPREVYPGQDQIIPSVGVELVVVCRRDLDPTIVYELTSALMRAYPRLSGVEASLRFLNPEEAPATPMPLHPGAARYFRERELSR